MLLSIIIPNYNYERFVGAAIESALALDYAPKEIIIIDDGSTDNSREVIERYVRRNPETVRLVTKPNGGQGSALNAGFMLARGDLIYTLDSDDIVHPNMAKEVIKVWYPSLSKVQFFLEIIDAHGNFVWFNKQVVRSPEEIRQEVLETGSYPCPPMSGNVYSKEFLRQVMPIPPEIWADTALNALAPLYGEIATVSLPLGKYRMHERNAQSRDSGDITEPQRKHIKQMELRDQLLETHCERRGIAVQGGLRHRDHNALTRRFISLRLRPDLHPIARDRLLTIFWKTQTAVSKVNWLRPSQRRTIMIWLVALLILPSPIGRQLAKMRLVPGYRPKALVALLRITGSAADSRVGAR